MRLPVRLTTKVARSVLKMKKESPHIFFVAGVIGTVTSAVMASRATLKLPETLNQIQYDLSRAKELRDNVQPMLDSDEHPYNDMDYYKDMGHIYGMAGYSLLKLYGPSILIGGASIGLLTGSHVQMTRRNSALMAAYAAVQKAFDDYRDRVRGSIGEEYELDYYRGVTEEVKDKDGNKVKIVDPNKSSPYACIFDEYNENWNKDAELNLMFVRCQMNWANNRLQRNGHLFLNEVYDMLGFDRTSAGAMVGWLKDGDGDGYVDFGIYQASKAAFVEGWERSVWLDFNVDGVIYDKI